MFKNNLKPGQGEILESAWLKKDDKARIVV
jgi:hypothetical protein